MKNLRQNTGDFTSNSSVNDADSFLSPNPIKRRTGQDFQKDPRMTEI